MTVLLILAGALSLLLGTAVLVGQRIGVTGKYFFATTFCGFMWAVCIALFLNTHDSFLMSLFARMYYVAAAGIAAFTLVTALSFGRGLSSRFIDVLALVPFAVFSLCIIMNESTIIDSVDQLNGSNVVALNAVGYGFYVVYFILYYLTAMAVLYIGSKNKKHSRLMRAQLSYVLHAYGWAGLLGATFNLVLPAMGNYQLIWVGPLSLFIFIPVVYFSISHHGLFNIRVAAVRTFAYVLSITTMTLMYFALIYAISRIFLRQSEYSTINMSFINLVPALVLAFLFQPVKRFFDKITDKIFFRGQYKNEDFINRIGVALTTDIRLEVLLKNVLNEIVTTLKASEGMFVIYKNGENPTISTTCEKVNYSNQEMLELREFLSGRVGHSVLLANQLQDHSLKEQDRERYAKISKRGAQVIVPLFSEKSILGVIILAEQKADGYSKRDLNVLDTVSNEIAIAVQHSLGREEIQLLNNNLEKRINQATKELRHTNTKLRKLDETKDEFISMASHQLRTPLTSIKGYLSMVLDGDVGKVPQDQHKLLSEAYSSSERMVHLIGDFLNVSRLQTGKFVIDAHPTDLAAVVAEEVASITQLAESHGLKIVFREPKNIPVLYLDADKLRQVIMNFLDNAIYYSPDSGEITVKLYKKDGEVLFEVKDQGMGVPEDVQGRLFTKFFRADNARKQRPDGTGIGLFLAKKVVTQQGGDIIFESTSGKGSTFGFRLPIGTLLKKPTEKAE